MDTQMSNDTRGWIMTLISGIACVFGASIICVDVIVRQIPSQRNFSVQESTGFQAASLSLSFGVMIFSALYSMLPSSKKYLIEAGFAPSTAAWILLGSFVAGFVGIQVVSRALHHHIPSFEVSCDHTHKEASDAHENARHGSRRQSDRNHGKSHPNPHDGQLDGTSHSKLSKSKATEASPLLQSEIGASKRLSSLMNGQSDRSHKALGDSLHSRGVSNAQERRLSMMEVPARLMSFIKDTKTGCDEGGACFGYSDPCGRECFKHTVSKPSSTPTSSRHPSMPHTETGNFSNHKSVSILHDDDQTSSTIAHCPPGKTRRQSCETIGEGSSCNSDEDLEGQHHHHHVPANAFMDIGLQTSIAIALHKLPEGFITYATNHANPSLGFSVFMALFMHNITEGFALALPLYLALNSRLRAMLCASLLGGLSQPMGAAVAATWFKLAGKEGHNPGAEAYGCMFAITAGIMASVALQLFSESLAMNHNRNLCMAFAFVGMVIMSASNALTS